MQKFNYARRRTRLLEDKNQNFVVGNNLITPKLLQKSQCYAAPLFIYNLMLCLWILTKDLTTIGVNTFTQENPPTKIMLLQDSLIRF